jgi:hypothetical protein
LAGVSLPSMASSGSMSDYDAKDRRDAQGKHQQIEIA